MDEKQKPVEFIYYNESDGFYVLREVREQPLPCTIFNNSLQTPAWEGKIGPQRVSKAEYEELFSKAIVKRIPDQARSPSVEEFTIDMNLIYHIVTACASSLATCVVLYVALCLGSEAQLTSATFFVLIALLFMPHWRLEAFVDAHPEFIELLFTSIVMYLGA